jgi:hypothetical protein
MAVIEIFSLRARAYCRQQGERSREVNLEWSLRFSSRSKRPGLWYNVESRMGEGEI